MQHLAATAAALSVIALALVSVEAAEEDTTPGLLTAEELNAPAPGAGPVLDRAA